MPVGLFENNRALQSGLLFESACMSDRREQSYEHFVRLLASCDHRIRRFVRSLVPTAEGVDDIVQETALECWKKFADFQPTDGCGDRRELGAKLSPEPDTAAEEFLRWACVVARYKTLSWQRDQARDRLVFDEAVVHQLADRSLERLGGLDQHRAAVQRCLQKLDHEQRQILLAVHQRGQSIAALASKMGVRARPLYTKLNALRKRLADCVSQKLAAEVPNG